MVHLQVTPLPPHIPQKFVTSQNGRLPVNCCRSEWPFGTPSHWVRLFHKERHSLSPPSHSRAHKMARKTHRNREGKWAPSCQHPGHSCWQIMTQSRFCGCVFGNMGNFIFYMTRKEKIYLSQIGEVEKDWQLNFSKYVQDDFLVKMIVHPELSWVWLKSGESCCLLACLFVFGLEAGFCLFVLCHSDTLSECLFILLILHHSGMLPDGLLILLFLFSHNSASLSLSFQMKSHF